MLVSRSSLINAVLKAQDLEKDNEYKLLCSIYSKSIDDDVKEHCITAYFDVDNFSIEEKDALESMLIVSENDIAEEKVSGVDDLVNLGILIDDDFASKIRGKVR